MSLQKHLGSPLKRQMASRFLSGYVRLNSLLGIFVLRFAQYCNSVYSSFKLLK